MSEALLDSNPWWKGEFFDIGVKERKTFKQIEAFVSRKQIVGVYGLRRTGKSFFFYYLIKKLLEKENPKSIIYFSFDAFKSATIAEIVKTAEELTETKPKFLFLDEVQKVNNWAEQVKRIYDIKNIKIFISGSESLFLKKASKESLAGRIFEFEMNPLSFSEYLEFKGIKTGKLYSEEIKKALNHYLLTSGFPELVNEKDSFFTRKYIKEGIIDKAIFKEIPEKYAIEDPSILEKIMNIIIDNPGLLVDKNSLASDLGIFRTTVSKYLFYLESSFLIKKTFNFSKNASTSEKKLKKYYPCFSCLALGTKNDETYFGKIVETACVNKTRAKFFWRSPQKDEVDIVLTKPLMPIEIKYKENPKADGLKKFMHVFNAQKSLIITKNTEKTENKTKYIPFWKWMLED